MQRRFNCCVFNHPCPIFCPNINMNCRNDVVSPTTSNDFGFFNNLEVGEIATETQIPLSLVSGEGTSITSNGSGAVVLVPGNYEVNYFVNGTIPAGGTLSVKLTLNGSDVSGSTISVTETAGNIVSVSQTIVVTTMQTATLALVNSSTESVTFQTASMLVKRI